MFKERQKVRPYGHMKVFKERQKVMGSLKVSGEGAWGRPRGLRGEGEEGHRVEEDEGAPLQARSPGRYLSTQQSLAPAFCLNAVRSSQCTTVP
eukprot:364505-Chlamydomonas_euryale.AAC.11